ncbi:DUF192 domain-containing protein [Parapusillimonas sp. SGNA-6]|nr:DUF192 domain-containing protein [Parapusillimonas sp. SGNA-6]
MHKFYRLTGLSGPVFFPFLLAATLLLSPVGLRAQSMLLPMVDLKVGPHAVRAEVAATEDSRSYGLMNRASLPADQGMLFVFDEIGQPCFWMKNTPLPLSIAFIDAAGTIVNIADMQPRSLDTHCPAAPILYALEMQQGWFRHHRVEAGTRLQNLPRPKR